MQRSFATAALIALLTWSCVEKKGPSEPPDSPNAPLETGPDTVPPETDPSDGGIDTASIDTASIDTASPEPIPDGCNGIDDDGDGEVDEDPDLSWWLDEDGDGVGAGSPVLACAPPSADYVGRGDDCDDTEPTVAPTVAELGELCADHLDNDCNRLTDCEEDACFEAGDCREDCDDGDDNDRDLLPDCEDPDCVGERPCLEDCDDGDDNDLDGLIDCEDADCVESADCTEDCNDNLDDDGDGLTDCDDDDCWSDTDCLGAVRILGGRHTRSERRWTHLTSSRTTTTRTYYGGISTRSAFKKRSAKAQQTFGTLSGSQWVSTSAGGQVPCAFSGRPFAVRPHYTSLYSVQSLSGFHTTVWKHSFGVALDLESVEASSACPVETLPFVGVAAIMGLSAGTGGLIDYYDWEQLLIARAAATSTGVVTSMGLTTSAYDWQETLNRRSFGTVFAGDHWRP